MAAPAPTDLINKHIYSNGIGVFILDAQTDAAMMQLLHNIADGAVDLPANAFAPEYISRLKEMWGLL